MEILLAVAVAVVAVAGWFTSSTYRAKTREHTAELERLSRRVADAERQLGEHATVSEGASSGLTEFRQQVERQLAEAGRDLTGVNQQLKDIGGFVRARLGQDVASTRTAWAHRVLIAALHTERPTAAGSLPTLFTSFLRELPAPVLFVDTADAFGIRSYRIWDSPDGELLEDRLSTLLRACPDGTPQDGTPEPVRGVAELRALLTALYRTGPGTLQVGPLLAVRTRDGFTGAVLDVPQLDRLDRLGVPATATDSAARLRDLAGSVTDLGSWAQG